MRSCSCQNRKPQGSTRTANATLWKQCSPEKPHQGEHLASETPSGISSCVVEVHSIKARAARQAGSSCQKLLWDAYNKFWLVLSGKCTREVSDPSCVESRGCYCCSEGAVAAVPMAPPSALRACSSASTEGGEGPSWLLSLPCFFQKDLLVWQCRGTD